MIYTVGEMARKLNVPASTLRFYDKMGLLPFVERSSGGVRMFREEDFEWLQVIGCLKKAGMKLCDIKKFIQLAMQGDETIDMRLELITAQKQEVERQLTALHKTLAALEFKQWYYRTAKADGTTQRVRHLGLEELPEQFREVRKELRGE